MPTTVDEWFDESGTKVSVTWRDDEYGTPRKAPKREIGVYIAGPMYSSGDLVTNARAALDAAAQLEAAGSYRPFLPQIHALTWQLVYPRSHESAQEWDDFWLLRCDAVLRLPGRSVGADHETELAREAGIKVFYSVRSLVDALPTD